MNLGLANLTAGQGGALLVSLAIEAVVAGLAARATGWAAPGRAALVAVVATLLTHPFAWNAVLAFAEPETWGTVVLAVEAAVIVVEGVAQAIGSRCGLSRGLVLSAFANGASAGFGLLVDAVR